MRRGGLLHVPCASRLRGSLVFTLLALGACEQSAGETTCEAQYEAVQAFVASHRECRVDSDCAIIGGCSGSFGFTAVTASARDEGQRLPIDEECALHDGSLYAPLCEQGSCVMRPTGGQCGGIASPCRDDQELYRTTCTAPDTCLQRCEGGADARCGAGFSCQPMQVVPVSGECSATLTRAMCAPAPSCEVLLSIEGMTQSPADRGTARSQLLGSLPLELWAENLTQVAKTFRYQRPCPGGPTLTGIGEYDAWGVCLAGACPTNPPTEVTLAPRQRVSLGQARIDAQANDCNPSPLAPGNYAVGFVLEAAEGATLCGPVPYQLSVVR